jgi:SAM-dependent methyltransferase
MPPIVYWQGNAAKSRVISDLLARTSGREALVFDYGCGAGGDWARILDEHRGLRLVGYEPHAPSFRAASERLRGRRAEVLTGAALATLALQADFIVSFSVLEHVFDRRAFFANARRLLHPQGLFYLNYDDGHFRAPPPKERLQNLLAGVLARTGFVSRYQRRVTHAEAEALLREAGFAVEHAEYHNLAAFKDLFKRIEPAKQEAFARFWVDVEARLNADFEKDANLWSQLASRTLWLRHAR